MKEVSIIIKALNEEEHISKCVKSALLALKELKGEVILVDSISTDKTVEIAQKFPIKIIQLKNKKDRRCGIGPQAGYLYSEGKYVYILDGDMKIDKNFIKKALPYFKDKTIAGIGGNITEKSTENLAFQVRTKHHVVKHMKEVRQLGMGGLYRREALEKIGYFSNPYLYAYEEYDLAAKLNKAGYRIIRIPETMVEHYGDVSNSLMTFINRFKSRYIFGSGQYLKRAIVDKHLLRTVNELKIYISTLSVIIFGIISMLFPKILLKFFIGFLLISFTFLMLIKRDIKKTFFSIFSWNFQAIGMLIGFFMGAKSPKKFKPEVVIIKNGKP